MSNGDVNQFGQPPQVLPSGTRYWYLAKEEGDVEWDSRVLTPNARCAAIYHAEAVAELEGFSEGDGCVVVVKDELTGEETTWDASYVLVAQVALQAGKVRG